MLDLGAGKALLTRAVYEANARRVAVIALDVRREKNRDRFYDPPTAGSLPTDAGFTRTVGDTRDLSRLKLPEATRGGGVVALAKHLCGGATDGSLEALCRPPLTEFVGACCVAPCCHQKTRLEDYCNRPFLEAVGFGSRDDWRTLMMLLQISRATELREFEYRKSYLLALVGFRRAKRLGVIARRLLEEGRLRYLRERGGFTASLVRYVDAEVTPDNLAIVAMRENEAHCQPCATPR